MGSKRFEEARLDAMLSSSGGGNLPRNTNLTPEQMRQLAQEVADSSLFEDKDAQQVWEELMRKIG